MKLSENFENCVTSSQNWECRPALCNRVKIMKSDKTCEVWSKCKTRPKMRCNSCMYNLTFICFAQLVWGKYLVYYGEEERRKNMMKIFGEGKYLVQRGEEERRRKGTNIWRKTIFGDTTIFAQSAGRSEQPTGRILVQFAFAIEDRYLQFLIFALAQKKISCWAIYVSFRRKLR